MEYVNFQCFEVYVEEHLYHFRVMALKEKYRAFEPLPLSLEVTE